jgi:predicted transcriptional regulator
MTDTPAENRLLTDAELELMNSLWTHGPSTAREVHGRLPDDRAYTTVSTILRILADKGFATTHKQGRAHVFTPSLTRGEYRIRKLRSVVDGLFDGSPVDLVRHLVGGRSLSPDEVEALKSVVDELEE